MAVRELSELQYGTIRLGSGATTVTYLLPRILGAYQRRTPSEALALAVHQQKLDLAVVMLPVQPSLALELLPILREELVYVVHSNDPLAAKQVIHPQDILEIPFISFLQGSAMQMNLDTHFAAMGITPRITMEMENIEAIKALVQAGIGAAVLPACSVSPTQGTIRPLRIRGFRMERELALALPKATVLPQAIQKLASSGSTLTQTFVLMFGLRLSSRKQLTPCGGSLFSLLRLTGSILH